MLLILNNYIRWKKTKISVKRQRWSAFTKKKCRAYYMLLIRDSSYTWGYKNIKSRNTFLKIYNKQTLIKVVSDRIDLNAGII